MPCEVAEEEFKKADQEFWRLASEVKGLEKSLTPSGGGVPVVVVVNGSPEEAQLAELRSQRDDAYRRADSLGHAWMRAREAHTKAETSA